MQQTEHFNLNQYELTDRILMENFNSDNAKIDAALAGKADASALTALAETAGNCKIVTGSYTGTGTYGSENPNTLTFNFEPKIVFLDIQNVKDYNSVPEYYILFRGASQGNAYGTSSKLTVTWNGNSVSWYYTGGFSDSAASASPCQFNKNGQTYHYLAIG